MRRWPAGAHGRSRVPCTSSRATTARTSLRPRRPLAPVDRRARGTPRRRLAPRDRARRVLTPRPRAVDRRYARSRPHGHAPGPGRDGLRVGAAVPPRDRAGARGLRRRGDRASHQRPSRHRVRRAHLPPRPRPSAAHLAPGDPGVPGVSGHRLRRPDSACAARDLRAGRPGNARRNTLADADRGVLGSRRDVLVDLLPFGGDVGRRGVRRALPSDCGCGQPRRGVGVGRAGGRRRPEDRRELGRARGGDRPRRALGASSRGGG